MRRWGDGDRFRDRIDSIRSRYPDAAFRSSFIVGYPGETEEDHDELLAFIEAVELDWAGFFAYSREEGTYAAGLPDVDTVDAVLVAERLRECHELQDAITARRRSELIGTTVEVLVDEPGVGRSHREAPEIDGVIHFSPDGSSAGRFMKVTITDAAGPDLEAVPARQIGVGQIGVGQIGVRA
jgi:tRNA A37 methylthiotransferase MiaB